VTKRNLHLASASPRRREILDALGLRYTFAGVDVDESRISGEAAATMALRLAVAKAETGAQTVESGCVILAADTVVALGDTVFGKPSSEADAGSMLSKLSGRHHRVITAVAVLSENGVCTAVSESIVQFREISADEAAYYWQSGEPHDKAGAYAIQGKGGIFVESLSGSYSCVVGLPIFETARLLGDAGVPVLGPTGT